MKMQVLHAFKDVFLKSVILIYFYKIIRIRSILL